MFKIDAGSSIGLPPQLVLAAVSLLLLRIGVAVYERVHPAKPTDEIKWDSKVTFSKEFDGKPMLLNFTAAWCLPCKMLDNSALSDKQIISTVKANFVPVKIFDRKKEDGENSKEVQHLQDKCFVTMFPTLVTTLSNGTIIEARVGVSKPSELNKFLKDALTIKKYAVAKELFLEGRYEEAHRALREFLTENNYKHWRCVHASIIDYLTLCLLGRNDEAKKNAKEEIQKYDLKVWPYQFLEYCADKLTYEDLLHKVGDDLDDRISMHANIGIEYYARKKLDKAKEHLEWILENCPRNYFEYRAARVFMPKVDAEGN